MPCLKTKDLTQQKLNLLTSTELGFKRQNHSIKLMKHCLVFFFFGAGFRYFTLQVHVVFPLI